MATATKIVAADATEKQRTAELKRKAEERKEAAKKQKAQQQQQPTIPQMLTKAMDPRVRLLQPVCYEGILLIIYLGDGSI